MSLLNYFAKRASRATSEKICRLAIANSPNRPHHRESAVVQLFGDVEHADFRDAVALVRASARVADTAEAATELIVIAQSRPGTVRLADVQRLQQRNPLAGIVALLGTWCEGETRTGRPWPGVARFYWYEFPVWFRRQLSLRAAGRCPDWSRWEIGLTSADPSLAASRRTGAPAEPRMARDLARGVVLLSTTNRETADAMSDVLGSAGYASVWQRASDSAPFVRGAVAGVWDGGQLDDREAGGLAEFCRRLHRNHMSVIALLDFPRRDRVEHALECGATAVLGKPWRVEDLLGTIEQNLRSGARSDGHANNRAA